MFIYATLTSQLLFYRYGFNRPRFGKHKKMEVARYTPLNTMLIIIRFMAHILNPCIFLLIMGLGIM